MSGHFWLNIKNGLFLLQRIDNQDAQGDYHLKMQDRAAAIRAYERANQLDPSDEGVVKVLELLK